MHTIQRTLNALVVYLAIHETGHKLRENGTTNKFSQAAVVCYLAKRNVFRNQRMSLNSTTGLTGIHGELGEGYRQHNKFLLRAYVCSTRYQIASTIFDIGKRVVTKGNKEKETAVASTFSN